VSGEYGVMLGDSNDGCDHDDVDEPTPMPAETPPKVDPLTNDPGEGRVIILKIGGSSITHKAHEETLNYENLDWFAQLIASSVHESFLASTTTATTTTTTTTSKPKFVIVHGAGSFGHHSAKRFGLKCGKAAFLAENDGEPTATVTNTCTPDRTRYQMEALSKTRRSVQKLNASVVDRLIEKGVNAVGISPGMTFPDLRAHGIASSLTRAPLFDSDSHSMLKDRDVMGMTFLCQSIFQCLNCGLVPVIHGDACLLHDGMRAGILGGDTLVEGIANLWGRGHWDVRDRIGKVIFITDVGGVYSSDPKVDSDAELIRKLCVNEDTGKVTVGDGDEDEDGKCPSFNVGGSSHAHDVTGGLKAKLGAAVTVVQTGIDVIIAQCGSVSAEKFVKGEFESVYDVEEGTLLTTVTRSKRMAL